MQDNIVNAVSVSSSDRKFLKRLKLILWATTLLFVLHALPGALMIEMYPITRWAMFSFPYSPLSEGSVSYLEVHVTDVQGDVIIIPYYDLFDSVPVGSVQDTLSTQLLSNASGLPSGGAAEMSPDVPEQARQALFERLDVIVDKEIAQVEIWRLYYDLDYARFPSVDFSSPIRSEQLIVLSASDTMKDADLE